MGAEKKKYSFKAPKSKNGAQQKPLCPALAQILHKFTAREFIFENRLNFVVGL